MLHSIIIKGEVVVVVVVLIILPLGLIARIRSSLLACVTSFKEYLNGCFLFISFIVCCYFGLECVCVFFFFVRGGGEGRREGLGMTTLDPRGKCLALQGEQLNPESSHPCLHHQGLQPETQLPHRVLQCLQREAQLPHRGAQPPHQRHLLQEVVW